MEQKRNDNPAAGVFIKGLVRKLPNNLLSMEEMEELYKQYSIQLNVLAVVGVPLKEFSTVNQLHQQPDLYNRTINVKVHDISRKTQCVEI